MTRLLTALCLILLGGAASATPEPGDLLNSMTKASRQLSFRGHLLYAQEDFIRTLEIIQGRIDDTLYQRVTSLDGEATTMVRQGSQVYHIDSDRSLTRLGTRAGVGSLNLDERFARTVPEHYQMVLDGHGRIAGRAAWRVLLMPMDRHRYGYRLWIDEDTHLLLRADTMNSSGRWLERFEYVNLEVSPELSRSRFDLPDAADEEVLETVDPDARPQAGASVEPGWLPPGFSMVEQDVRRGRGDARPVSARSWTDGLAGFTLFLEQATGAYHEEAREFGPTVVISRLLDDKRWRVTLVGEIPRETAGKILAGVTLRVDDD